MRPGPTQALAILVSGEIMEGLLRLITFVLALHNTGSVPIPYGVVTFVAAEAHGVDPVDLGSVLIAEHRGHYDPRSVGRYDDTGTRGLFQLHPETWPRYCGITRQDLFDPWHNTDCAAQVLRYLQERHGDRARLEDNRAHYNRPGWRAAYRCASTRQARMGEPCRRSVARLLAVTRSLRRQLTTVGEISHDQDRGPKGDHGAAHER